MGFCSPVSSACSRLFCTIRSAVSPRMISPYLRSRMAGGTLPLRKPSMRTLWLYSFNSPSYSLRTASSATVMVRRTLEFSSSSVSLFLITY